MLQTGKLIRLSTMFILLTTSPLLATERFLIMNIGDGEDQQAIDASPILAKAIDETKPDAIVSSVDRYYVLLGEGATIQALDGQARKAAASEPMASAGPMSISESADAAAGAVDEGDTGWIEYQASVASVYYWSPTGEGESDWRQESPSLYIRRFADDKVVVMMGKKGLQPEN